MFKNLLTYCFDVGWFIGSGANSGRSDNFVKENYSKKEYDIPMRDGIKLHTIVYSPKDAAADK